MSLIRKILLCSLDIEWNTDFIKLLTQHAKITCDLATTRTEAISIISQKDVDILIFEDTFLAKNIEIILRAIPEIHWPTYIIFLTYDFVAIKEMVFPKDIQSKILIYSMPIPKNQLVEILAKQVLPTGLKNQDFDIEFIQYLIQSTKSVLEHYTQAKLTVGNYGKQYDDEQFAGAVNGKIILKTDYFSGTFFICFPTASFAKLVEKVLGEKPTPENGNHYDFAGEIANNVFGQVKKELHQQGINLSMAIPVTDNTSIIKSEKPIVIIPFESEIGPIYIKVAANLF